MIYIIFIVFALLSWIVQSILRHRMKKYSRTALLLSGKEIVEKMLEEHGIQDVKIAHVQGKLSDHYNPSTRTINLSEDVYFGRHIAAAAIAAHECGHAVQHASAYSMLRLRSALVPVVSFASQWMQWVLLIGILTVERYPSVLLAGIALFSLTTFFSLVTLPVEVNASKRAIRWLSAAGITDRYTLPMAADALKWAAYTYFIAALSSLATLFYYILIFMGARDRH